MKQCSSSNPWFRPTLAALLALAGCIDKYVPDVATSTTGYLVVDGFINGNGRTRISLSRTISLATTTTPPAEKGARVYILDDAGGSYALTERSSGTYVSDSLVLSPARQYHLRLTTAGSSGGTYESGAETLQTTPAIDQLHYRLANDQVQLLLDTHDATGQTRYYRWQVSETWQFNAAYVSHLEYRGGTVQARITPIYTCWRTELASAIRQGSTAALSQSVLTDVPLLAPAANSERFKVRYSVLVTQVAESASEFAYYELLRKNTEAVGTVNDPLPVQLTGNVHRTDATTGEPVLGFVGAHTAQTRRLFIDHRDLPTRSAQDYTTPYTSCQAGVSYFCDPFGQCNLQDVYDLFKSPDSVPLDYVSDPTSGLGISSATADCTDCRRRGSNVKPSFW